MQPQWNCCSLASMFLVHMGLYYLEYVSFSNILEMMSKEDLPVICSEKFVSFLIDRFDYSIF